MEKVLLPFAVIALLNCASEPEPAKTEKATTATPQVKPQAEHKGRHGRHKMDPAEHAQMLQKKLGLTDEQTKKITDIFTAEQPKRRELHQRIMELHKAESPKAEAFAALKVERKALRTQLETKMKEVLTPEQLTKFQQIISKHHKGGHYRHHKLDPAARAEMLQNKLGLNDEQLGKVKAVFTELMPKKQELYKQLKAHFHGEAKLSDDKLTALQDQKAAVKKQIATRLAAIFTADQLAQYQKLRPHKEMHKSGDCGCKGGCAHAKPAAGVQAKPVGCPHAKSAGCPHAKPADCPHHAK